MRIPYVIDNETHKLADILNSLLAEHKERSLDIATAYFTVGGFALLREGLQGLGSFRLLLGFEPAKGEDIGLRPSADTIKKLIEKDLEDLPFTEEKLRLVEDLIAFLGRETVAVRMCQKGFLHAKCYLFYGDRAEKGWERFQPLVGIVGSSNFTIPGLTSNRELNLTHKTLLSEEEVADDLESPPWPLDESVTEAEASYGVEARRKVKSTVGARAIADLDCWYERQWKEARDYKAELVELLDASKFGKKEYTPYQVYMKTLYEYFKDELGEAAPQPLRSAIELAEFQEAAVKKARKILSRYDGVMVADSVGLGKTWIGKQLLEDYAYHMRQKALVVCPASLRDMWGRELHDASISTTILSQEELGREEFDPTDHGDADVILVDESHNFRNRNTHRYENLERLIGLNGGRGRDGLRKKLMLLTATPINNDLMDLYNQLSLVTQGDRGYFSACGIGDLHRYFLNARRHSRAGASAFALFNLLEETVIRRTRPFIRRAYPEATIQGKKVTFPKRRLRTVTYNLEATYEGIYDEVVSGIESLKLAPYNLESYKKAGVEVDEFEAGREQALVGIFKSRYLKRFESSIEAFRISVRRALEFQKTFESFILDGRVLKSSQFQKAVRYLEREGEEDDATPTSRSEELDASEEARAVLEEMESVDPAQYDLRRMHESVQHDIEVFSAIWQRVKEITPEKDAKLNRLKELLAGKLKGEKVLVFSYYKDTARYLYRELTGERGAAFREQAGDPTVRRMDSGADAKERMRIVQSFAPKWNNRPEWSGTDREIDILISTDVLSEGQNLQDCGILVNYDLHWNPTRMVQRAGRIDRIGTDFKTLWIHNMFPDEGLERLLKLVESLSRKISAIDRAGFLDASVLGEAVHPRNFNTLRRIREEDGMVIEEEEQFTELASSEFLLQQLKALLDAEGRDTLESLPDGIHSGLATERAKGVFFYLQAEDPGGEGKLHFWEYYDLVEEGIVDNRYVIANLISCERDTPRVVADYDIFALQEKAIEDILRSFDERQALEAAPRTVDPLQQVVATALQGYLNHPDVDRGEAIAAIRYLSQPMLSVQVKELRKGYSQFQKTSDIQVLLAATREMQKRYGTKARTRAGSGGNRGRLDREALRLICFDLICS